MLKNIVQRSVIPLCKALVGAMQEGETMLVDEVVIMIKRQYLPRKTARRSEIFAVLVENRERLADFRNACNVFITMASESIVTDVKTYVLQVGNGVFPPKYRSVFVGSSGLSTFALKICFKT